MSHEKSSADSFIDPKTQREVKPCDCPKGAFGKLHRDGCEFQGSLRVDPRGRSLPRLTV